MAGIDERIGRRIKLADLHVLMAAVETGSMGKAAQRLNTSQPAVSRCIADLERALQVTLLDRTPRGIELTAHGRTLLDAAASAFDSLRNGIQHIGLMSDPAAGTVRIGGNEAMITALLPPVVSTLRERYPSLSVTVQPVGAVHQQYAELRERRLDFIIGRIHPPYEDDVEAQTLYQETTHVVAAATNPWNRRGRRFAFRELADEPWALPSPGTLVGALFAEAFRASGIDYPPRCAIIGNIHLHCELVASSSFLAILPGSVLRRNAERFGLRVLPVSSPVAPAPVGILRLRHRPMTPVARLFIAALQRGME